MRASALGLALVTALFAGGCGDGGESAAAGDLVRGRLGDVDGTSHTLLLPNGTLTVDVGEGQEVIAATDAADGREHVAPDGTEWVALAWHLDPGQGLDSLQQTLMEDKVQRTTLELVSDDVSTDLGDAPGSTSTPAEVRTAGPVYVAVAADATPVVEVSFDGVTTSLDLDTGEVSGDRAEGLTDLAPPVSTKCPPLTGPGVSADVACTYTLTTVPYLAGDGWSDQGWTVAMIETRTDSFDRGEGTYDVQDVADRSGLDGQTGQSTVVDERLTSLVSRVVAEGAPDRLEISRVLTGLLVDGSGPEDLTVELGATVELD